MFLLLSPIHGLCLRKIFCFVGAYIPVFDEQSLIIRTHLRHYQYTKLRILRRVANPTSRKFGEKHLNRRPQIQLTNI